MYRKKKEDRLTVSFYKYFEIKDLINFKVFIYNIFKKFTVLGRVYIANEGINAQISVLSSKLEQVKQSIICRYPRLKDMMINISLDNSRKSFEVLKIKIRKKIVSDGITDNSFDYYKVGKYLKSKKVNEMILNQDAILVDIRNRYEYNIGHFDNSINIFENTFREQLNKIILNLIQFKNKNIIMYCTGGIRCEKATAWLIHHGFKKVFHIAGGIIGYVNNAKKNNLPVLFKGKNFVFDLRMFEKITEDVLSVCYHCNQPYDLYINCKRSNCNLLFIQCLTCQVKYHGYCSLKCFCE